MTRRFFVFILVSAATLIAAPLADAKTSIEANVIRNPQLGQQIQGLTLPKRMRVENKRAVLKGHFSEKGWKLEAAMPHKLKMGRRAEGGFRIVVRFTSPSQSVILTAIGPRGIIVEETIHFEIPPQKWINAEH